MKIVRQLLLILLFSLMGEILNSLLPLPIPASIYGLLLLFAALCLHIVKLEDVHRTATFLISIMPLMFIPAAVGLVSMWDAIRPKLLAFAVIMLVSTVLVMAVSGLVTQSLLPKKEKKT